MTSGAAPSLSKSYFECLDVAALNAAYPIGSAFTATYCGMSCDELRARQEQQFTKLMAFAWQVPFYQRLWGQRSIEPGDILSLDDLQKLPVYSKHDLMRSVERFPPIGDFHGLDSYADRDRPPLIMQTTSGTTGRPQPLLCGPKSREVQAMLLGRIYALQGMTNRDVVHSVYGHGMVNGGHYVREAINHWIGALLLSAGTGIETRSVQQIRLLHEFRATVVVGFADYIGRLARIAREQGLELGVDLPVRMISCHLGAESREAMSSAWGGAQVYDWYGVGDTGAIAAEGPDQDGLYLMEDAQFIELLDVTSGAAVSGEQSGDIVCTSLYKDDVFPIIRFNTHDITRISSGSNAINLPFRRMAGFLGRSDNMVKLRGVNVFPQGIGAILNESFAVTTGEFICLATSTDGRDEMLVQIEVDDRATGLKAAMEDTLKARLGVAISVQLVATGATAQLTGIDARQKPIRLVDER